MKNNRTFNIVEESYLRDHSEEIDVYFNRVFAYREETERLLVEGLESGTSRPLDMATLKKKGQDGKK